MAFVLKDRVQETTTTSGTGTVTLLGAVSGFQSFGSQMANNDTTYYVILDTAASPPQWEIGTGTYTTAGTQLSRDSVLASTNAGSKVNFSSNTKYVFMDAPADRLMVAPASGAYNTYILTVDLGATPVYSTTISTTIPASLWAITTALRASPYGADFQLIAAGQTAYGDEYEMDGLAIAAQLGAASPNINLYIQSTSGGPIAGQRKIGITFV